MLSISRPPQGEEGEGVAENELSPTEPKGLAPEGIGSLVNDCSLAELEERLPEHMKSVYESAILKLNPTEKVKVAILLTDFADVFLNQEFELGKFDLLYHEIELIAPKPFWLPLRTSPVF